MIKWDKVIKWGNDRRRLLSPLAFIFLSVLSLQAQTIDSLYAVFNGSRGEGRIVSANEIFRYAYEIELTDSLFFVKTTDEREFVDASVLEIMGTYFDNEAGNYVKSIEFHKQAIEIYTEIGRESSANKLNGTIGALYARMGNYESAVAYMMKCYEWEKKTGDNEGLSSTLNDLGVVYSQWGQKETAIHFFEEAEKVERPLNRPLQYANRLAQLAREYSLTNAEKALSLIKEALLYDEKNDTQRLREDRIAMHTVIMGDIYFMLGSFENAGNCYEQSLAYFEENGRTFQIANTLLLLGRLQVKSGRWGAAVATLKRCEEIAETNSFLRLQRDACILLIEAYQKLYPGDLIYFYFQKYIAITDTIFKETSHRQINDFQVRYETAEKQLEIERQQKEIERQRTRQFIFVGGLFVAGILMVLLIYIVALRTRRARLLSEMNAIKDKFFSIISHDLKNPTIAQRDSLQLLVNHVDKLDINKISGMLRQLLKSANGLVDLLLNLFHWAQIQTGREMYHPSEFNLVATIQPDICVIKSMAERKNIVFEALTPPTTFLTADENMLKTVVRNLLANAVKFTAEGGKISLHVNETGGKIIVSVNDTGVGMTPEQVQNLFRIDRQQTREGTAGEQSSGLGLIVCRDMLRKHGSELKVESEAGKGSRFWFQIFTGSTWMITCVLCP